MANDKKIRLGNGKKKNPTWLKASICLTDALEHSFSYEGKKYVKVDINIYDQPNDWGKDVAITLDTFKPEQNKTSDVPAKKSAPDALVEDAQVVDEDLPF